MRVFYITEQNSSVAFEQADGTHKKYLVDDQVVVDYLANGGVITPKFTQAFKDARAVDEENRKKREVRGKKLDKLVITTTNGNTFDADSAARLNMNNALSSSQFLGQTEAHWKLANNSVVLIQLNELQEALALATQQVGLLIIEPTA